MSVVLDFLKRSNTTPKADDDVYSIDNTAAVSSNAIFRDIYLDLDTTSFFTTNRLDAKESVKAIRILEDEACILQSIRNILTTSPGQKLLNPNFGVNLGKLLFNPIDIQQAHFMAEVISKELQRQEPRARFTGVHVEAQPDESSYSVYIKAVIPNLSKRELRMSGIITVNGIKIERIESNTIA
tara:strand:- start:162 stop:710 length:549 start_codon:yes stop_codon:yes gene_type:complete